MKRFAAMLCALALLLGPAPVWNVPSAQAAGPAGQVSAYFYNETQRRYDPAVLVDQVRVTLDGQELETDAPGMIQTVDGLNGRTLVPVRTIAEPLGATVMWIAETRQVMILNGDDTIVLTIGSDMAVVNGESVPLPDGVPASVVSCNGAERTMVPLRFVSEHLHAKVEWDGETYTAAVTSPSPEGPQPSRGLLVRIDADDNAQTVTLLLSQAPLYRITDLGDKVAIDLLGVTIGSGRDGSMTPENPVIRQVRYAQHDDDIDPRYARTTRVVLDLVQGCSYQENVSITTDVEKQAVVVTVTPPSAANMGQEPGPEEPLPQPGEPLGYLVALDAGHGGSASGALYEEVMEKDITLPITLRVAQLLEAAGCQVILTRSEDVYMDLYDRCRVANGAGADIFVSIHANASSTNRAFEGTFTYSYPGSTAGAALAGCIQDAVVAAAGSRDRGLLTNDYVVLRETTMPAALLETGFMSCHEELMRLIDPEYQEKLAQGTAKGILDYLATLPKE